MPSEQPVRRLAEYDAIREDRLWDIVHADFPSLLLACENALRELEKS